MQFALGGHCRCSGGLFVQMQEPVKDRGAATSIAGVLGFNLVIGSL